MRIKVDWDLCQGHANCTGDAPEVFHVDADGKMTVLIEQPGAELREKVESAVKYCPTGALTLEK